MGHQLPIEPLTRGVERHFWALVKVISEAKKAGIGIFKERIAEYEVVHVAIPVTVFEKWKSWTDDIHAAAYGLGLLLIGALFYKFFPWKWLVSKLKRAKTLIRLALGIGLAFFLMAKSWMPLSLVGLNLAVGYYFSSQAQSFRFNLFVYRGRLAGWDADRWVDECSLWLDHKHLSTMEHTVRSSKIMDGFGEYLGWPKERVTSGRRAAIVHDIGKLCIPDSLIEKPARLTLEEQFIVRKHVRWSEILIARIPALKDIVTIVGQHHENYDGSGYPRALNREEIDDVSSALSIVDAYDAMIETRAYKLPKTQRWAFWELRRCAGTQFDPYFVEKFILFMGGGEPDIAEPPQTG